MTDVICSFVRESEEDITRETEIGVPRAWMRVARAEDEEEIEEDDNKSISVPERCFDALNGGDRERTPCAQKDIEKICRRSMRGRFEEERPRSSVAQRKGRHIGIRSNESRRE